VWCQSLSGLLEVRSQLANAGLHGGVVYGCDGVGVVCGRKVVVVGLTDVPVELRVSATCYCSICVTMIRRFVVAMPEHDVVARV